MVFAIFKGIKKREIENRFATFSEQLAHAFGQIKSDISEVNHKIDSNRRDLERVYQWIEYLNRHAQKLSDSHTYLSQKYTRMDENHQKLHTSHRELAVNHSKTAHVAESLENSHKELSNAILTHKNELRNEVHNQLRQHKDLSESELSKLKAWITYFSTHIEQQKRKEDDLKQDILNTQKHWADTQTRLSELLNGIKTENNELKSTLSTVKNDLDSTKKELENTKNLAKNAHTLAKSESLRPEVAVSRPVELVSVPQPIIPQVALNGASFQRHILSRVMPNRRGYVLKYIMDLISENKYSTKEIEEIVVNEKQLCGRTSFFAYLKELKLKGRINYAEIDERQILISTDSQQKLQ